MESSFEGAVFDPVKCSKLSMEERREIVYELAKWSHGAPEMLQTWSRQDILQILCSEMGKERKYTGLTKLKIIEQLLRVVSEKTSVNKDNGVNGPQGPQSLPSVSPKGPKKPKKPDNPTRLPISTTNISVCNKESELDCVKYCKNSACKARLSKEDKFCKRCTCCICHKYDDNKDPSLWLTCSSDPPFVGDSCNMSCHLECGIKHEMSGISKNGRVSQLNLDGSFYCISCGKMNDLMSCWRKQLLVAKDTRRVDILCYRISLSQKLLSGTKKYEKACDIVEDAIKLLEAEVGALTGVPVKMGRGIVNRLSSGQEIQRLCGAAVDLFEFMNPQTQLNQEKLPSSGASRSTSPLIIRVETINPTSITVILGPDNSSSEKNVSYTLWHRKSNDQENLEQPTCTLFPPQTRFIVSNLSPSTEYIFKVVSFDNSKELNSSEIRLTTSASNEDIAKNSMLERIQSPGTNSTLSNPSSVEDETNHEHPSSDEENATEKFESSDQSEAEKVDIKRSSNGQRGEAMSTENESSEWPEKTSSPCIGPETSLPITPCRRESSKENGPHKKVQNGSLEKEEANNGRHLSKKRVLERERESEECARDDSSGGNLEYYIKVIRWLECEGHIDKSFRQKFLTWYGIRATSQEIRIVKVFVDTLIDDPASLSEQLQDTFGEIISSKKSSVVSPGICLKMWH